MKFSLLALTVLVTGKANALLPAPNFITPTEDSMSMVYRGHIPGPALGPGFVIFNQEPNIGSPVQLGANKVALIDQNAGIYLEKGGANKKYATLVDKNSAPSDVTLNNRQNFLSIAGNATTVFVVFTSNSAPTSGIPIHAMPNPVPGYCCNPSNPQPVLDLYRTETTPAVGQQFPFFAPGAVEYQVVYRYKFNGKKISNPVPLVAFETQAGPTHNGGALVYLPKENLLLFGTGDGLPFGRDGDAAPQIPSFAVGKIMKIDGTTGEAEAVALGVRNPQYFVRHNDILGFADIGGVTAEEINFVKISDLLDTTVLENFGWGRNTDGLAREGTFYVESGVALTFASPPVNAFAPMPEPGFIQPHAQYGRTDPLGGVAVSGPAFCKNSAYPVIFSDLSSGKLYGTKAALQSTDAPVFQLKVVGVDGVTYESFNDAVGLPRADVRPFTTRHGCGVMLEKTGDYYMLE